MRPLTSAIALFAHALRARPATARVAPLVVVLANRRRRGDMAPADIIAALNSPDYDTRERGVEAWGRTPAAIPHAPRSVSPQDWDDAVVEAWTNILRYIENGPLPAFANNGGDPAKRLSGYLRTAAGNALKGRDKGARLKDRLVDALMLEAAAAWDELDRSVYETAARVIKDASGHRHVVKLDEVSLLLPPPKDLRAMEAALDRANRCLEDTVNQHRMNQDLLAQEQLTLDAAALRLLARQEPTRSTHFLMLARLADSGVRWRTQPDAVRKCLQLSTRAEAESLIAGLVARHLAVRGERASRLEAAINEVRQDARLRQQLSRAPATSPDESQNALIEAISEAEADQRAERENGEDPGTTAQEADDERPQGAYSTAFDWRDADLDGEIEDEPEQESELALVGDEPREPGSGDPHSGALRTGGAYDEETLTELEGALSEGFVHVDPGLDKDALDLLLIATIGAVLFGSASGIDVAQPFRPIRAGNLARLVASAGRRHGGDPATLAARLDRIRSGWSARLQECVQGNAELPRNLRVLMAMREAVILLLPRDERMLVEPALRAAMSLAEAGDTLTASVPGQREWNFTQALVQFLDTRMNGIKGYRSKTSGRLLLALICDTFVYTTRGAINMQTEDRRLDHPRVKAVCNSAGCGELVENGDQANKSWSRARQQLVAGIEAMLASADHPPSLVERALVTIVADLALTRGDREGLTSRAKGDEPLAASVNALTELAR